MKKNNYMISEVFTLPSGGEIYDEKINPNIRLRSMTVKNEMQRLAPSTFPYQNLCDIIDDCIVDDIPLSVYDMCLGDYQYLLYKLRTVTYGSKLRLNIVCPHCGESQEIEVSMDDFSTENDIANIKDYKVIELPRTKQLITLKLQTPRMVDRISAKVNEFKTRRKGSSDDPTLLYSIENCIDFIDGEKLHLDDFDEWVKTLPMEDTLTIIDRSNKLNDVVKINTDIDATCTRCKRNFTTKFKITPEFFRPVLRFE